VKSAEVRLYLDADVLGLAKLLVQIRPDVTYPGDPGDVIHKRLRPPCPVPKPSTPDEEWIAEVSRRGWLIMTRDSAIQDFRAEIAAVRDHGAKMIALAGQEAKNTWAQLEIVMCQWRRIEELIETPGPYIYSATRTSMRQVPLD